MSTQDSNPLIKKKIQSCVGKYLTIFIFVFLVGSNVGMLNITLNIVQHEIETNAILSE